MSVGKLIVRTVSVGALCCLALAATALSALAFPQPLFAYHTSDGRLELYADRPFDRERGRELLADVERRISRSSLNDDKVHRIFIANSQWRRRLLFLWNGGAGGINYYPLTRNVFIRLADVNTDRVMTSRGEPKAPPRTLAYYAAHEIAHTLIGEQLSLLQRGRLPRWINEGLADDIGFADDIDTTAMTRRMQSGDPDFDPQRSGYYDRYRLLVRHVLQRKAWRPADLIAALMPQEEAEAMLAAEANHASQP